MISAQQLNSLAQVYESPLEALLVLYKSDREKFFELPKHKPIRGLTPPATEVLSAAKMLRRAAQHGFSFRQTRKGLFLITFSNESKPELSCPPQLRESLELLLAELGGAREPSAKGKDYRGRMVSKAELEYTDTPEGTESFDQRDSIKPRILSIAPQDLEWLVSKPLYVFEELKRFAGATVFNPTCVFEGIRREGTLSKGLAYCAKPESTPAYEDKVFMVFSDPAGSVFDWGWAVEDAKKTGYPSEWKERFIRELSNERGRLVGLEAVVHGEFKQSAAWYSTPGDCVIAYANEAPSYMVRLYDDFTLLVDLVDESKINGMKIKNFGRMVRAANLQPGDILEVKPGFTIDDTTINPVKIRLNSDLIGNATWSKEFLQVVSELESQELTVPKKVFALA